MVTFGGYPFPHVLEITTEDSRIENERLIPGLSRGHRSDQTKGGRTIHVAGEIRKDADYMLRTLEMRRRADNIARYLNLEDGQVVENAKLGTLKFEWTDEDGTDWVKYSADFYETG